MKISNFILSIFASLILGIAISSSTSAISMQPDIIIEMASNRNARFPDNINQKQTKLLNLAYKIAEKDGHSQPQLLQGIILQESLAGNVKSYRVSNPGKDAYFGVSQIKVSAARDVLNRWPELYKKFGFQTKSDDEIKAYLILDDVFNLTIASKYLLIMKSYGYSTIKQIALAYNRGPGGAKNYDPNEHYYPKAVISHINSLKIRD